MSPYPGLYERFFALAVAAKGWGEGFLGPSHPQPLAATARAAESEERLAFRVGSPQGGSSLTAVLVYSCLARSFGKQQEGHIAGGPLISST